MLLPRLLSTNALVSEILLVILALAPSHRDVAWGLDCVGGVAYANRDGFIVLIIGTNGVVCIEFHRIDRASRS